MAPNGPKNVPKLLYRFLEALLFSSYAYLSSWVPVVNFVKGFVPNDIHV